MTNSLLVRAVAQLTTLVVGVVAVVSTVASVHAARREVPHRPDQPAALVGTWVNVLGRLDTVSFTANGPERDSGIMGMHVVVYPTWRVVIDSMPAHNATLCADPAGGIGAALCDRLVLRGDSLSFARQTYVRAR